MPPQQLRDYQQSGVERAIQAWKDGARSILMTSPTGSGKTSCFVWICAQLAAAGQRSLILVHRRELATQASNRLREFGVDFGFIMAGEPPKPYAPVQIASVQTLIRRPAPRAALVVADEAHLSTAKTWTTILAKYPNARILGCTATPWRLGGKPLIGTYDDSVIVATPRELREAGHLCDYNGFSYLTPDLSDVKTVKGEYDEKQSAQAMSAGVIVDSVVEEWSKHARDMSTIVYAVNVEHSQALTARFKAAGVAAEHLDGKTPKLQRDAVLKRVESGQTRVLVNCSLFIEGLDIPRLKCCIDAAPTKSLARAIQRWGRVRRPWQGATARIHDHAFNIKLHGLPDADRDYSLHARPEKPPSLSTCEECLALYTGSSCPACSHENAPAEPTERKLNTIDDAEQWEFTSETEAPDAAPVEIRWQNPRVIEGRLRRVWTEPTDFGPQRRYLIEGKRSWVLSGTAHLNLLMSAVRVPDLVRVDYLGKLEGRHAFKLAVDDGR